MSKRTGCSDLEALYAQRHPLCPERIEALGCPGLRKVIFCDAKGEPCSLEYKGECQTYQDYIKGLEEVK